MSDEAWLTIVGLGEDGPAGLSEASRAALAQAEIVMGPARHLALLPGLSGERRPWPVPFADGLPELLALRGRRVVVLASGNPFWFGSGGVIAEQLGRDEWRALPGVSAFALAAARLGWRIEETVCLGLHAAPLERLRPHLAPGMRLIVLLRDGAAVRAMSDLLVKYGFGSTEMTVMERLGGPGERLTEAQAESPSDRAFEHPVCVGLRVAGSGVPIALASGRSDRLFESDGQMTRRPMRALTLSALAPQPFERLWDIGGGSGSVAIEWLLTHPTLRAVSVERRADRAARIRANADGLGADRLQVVTGAAPEALERLDPPNAVFVGGGLSAHLLDRLERLDAGTRLVANAVTLESEALLAAAQSRRGGDLLRIALADAGPLGDKRGWKASYPVVQWSVTL